MFPIKKKWPILTGLVAALFYGANYYRIAGFEHLRIEAVEQPQVAGPVATSSPSLPSTDVYGHGSMASHGTSRYAIRDSNVPQPPGGWRLNRSERFNLFQKGLSEPTGPTRPVSRTLPSTAPMQAPGGVQPQNIPGSLGSLASIDGNSAASSPGGVPPFSTTPVMPLPGAPMATNAPAAAGAGFPKSDQRIRIASFQVEALGAAKLDKPHVMQLIVSIIKQYEVVALQGIRSSRDDILPMLTERLNQSGATYDYMIGPRVGRAGEHEQFAFLFDTSRVETDRYRLYTVDDPQDMLTFEPLVGWFRTKGIAPGRAFTFSVVNMHLSAQRAAEERAILVDLIRAVETDGRQEDDWILLGDIAGGNRGLESLESTGVRFAVRDIPTLVDGSDMSDTIMFSPAATTEFTGRCGAFDFLRNRNLSIAEAQELSRHLPVWAEFSIDEGGMPGRVAPGRPPQQLGSGNAGVTSAARSPAPSSGRPLVPVPQGPVSQGTGSQGTGSQGTGSQGTGSQGLGANALGSNGPGSRFPSTQPPTSTSGNTVF